MNEEDEENEMLLEDLKIIIQPKTLIKILTVCLIIMVIFLGYIWGFRDAYDGLKEEHKEFIARYCYCRSELAWSLNYGESDINMSNFSLENK